MKRQGGISTRHNPSVRIKNSTAGITLIALVITIIVLLILAGVSIAALTGDNGILTKTQDAKTTSIEAELKEKIKLSLNGYQLEKNRPDSAITLEEYIENDETLINADYNAQNNTVTVETEDGKIYQYLINEEKIIEIEPVFVRTEDELVSALENLKDGESLKFKNDIKIDLANMKNEYATIGLNQKNGGTIDGNGYTLDIKGADGTWDYGISTTGGTIRNLTITGSFRGIFVNHNSSYNAPVIVDNVIIDGTVYTISCDQRYK